MHVFIDLIHRIFSINTFSANLDADITIDGERYMKRNRDYMKIKDFKFKVTNLEKLEMQFDNLFNGDKTLGKHKNCVLLIKLAII